MLCKIRSGRLAGGLALGLALSGVYAAPSPPVNPPARDPADLPFRWAPMAESARSVIAPLGENLHLAFDAELLRSHGAWVGAGLDLYGPPYSGAKSPFLAKPAGVILWGSGPHAGWWIQVPGAGGAGIPLAARFQAVSTREGRAQWIYGITEGEMKIQIHETPRSAPGIEAGVIRRFEISARDFPVWVLAHAEIGVGRAVSSGQVEIVMQEREQILSVQARGARDLKWVVDNRAVDEWREVITEAGTEKGWERRHVKGGEARLFLRIPPERAPVAVEVLTRPVTAVDENALEWNVVAPDMERPFAKVSGRRGGNSQRHSGEAGAPRRRAGDRFYSIESFPVPKELDLLVGGMDCLPNGDLAVCTWPGEVYIVEEAQGPVDKATYRRFARGLNEPLGLAVHDGEIYVTQKQALVRLRDTDGDGAADLHEVVSDGWGYSGNYHSYVFGPAIDVAGNFFLFITGQRGRWDLPYVGWCVRVPAGGGELEGFGSGLRVPNGFGFFGPDRDLFVTDNQGNWIGACKLNHVKQNRFYGFPSGDPAPKDLYGKARAFELPAVWFPRKLAPSASDLVEVRDDQFGPFQGQMFVGDFQNALVMRVALEKVEGEWQGAVFPFAKGFQGAVNRLAYGTDGRLYVGGCKRTWSAAAPQEYSLERIEFRETPFEVRDVRVKPGGFELRFTKAVDRESAEDPENYGIEQFTYRYQAEYGSPEIDQSGKENSATQIEIERIAVAQDGLSARFWLEGLASGYVTAFACPNLESEEGEFLRNDAFFYTLNRRIDKK